MRGPNSWGTSSQFVRGAPRRTRTPVELELAALYVVNDNPNELVYAIDLGKWFLIGEDRSFVVEHDGAVFELTGDETTNVWTLDAFEPNGRFMRRCHACAQFDDWGHQEICPVD
jgi:hypothetical protein